MNELVSVIIPTYNRESTIIRAVESVLSQTYKNIEVIIVDDCSTDGTLKLLKDNYSTNQKVRIYKLDKNSGACAARNKGIDVSQGKYIAFLDSDDVYYPKKIEWQMNVLEDDKYDLCATNYDRIDHNGTNGKITVKNLNGDNLLRELLFCNFITTGTLLGKKECFQDVKFDVSLARYQDWDLVLRLCKKYNFYFLNKSSLLQEYQKSSITSSTSHAKTFDALMNIYVKNYDSFKKFSNANTQIKWLIGIHSLFINSAPKYDFLWYGVCGDGFKIKRFFIYLMARLHMYTMIDKLFIQG